MNAAVIDPAFRAAFLEAPLVAARRALASTAETFGTTLPDGALQLPPLALSAADLVVLRDLPRVESLPAAARALRRLSAETHSAPAIEGVTTGELAAAASQEGAPAGSALAPRAVAAMTAEHFRRPQLSGVA